jgi:long-chain acyl-CoA synthetase
MYITQGLKRALQINRNGIATIDGARQRTWTEIAHRVARLAGALQKLGLQPGGRVAILSFNSDYFFEYYYAIAWAGGIIVPLNTRLAPRELVYMIDDAGAEILVVDDAHSKMLPSLAEATTVRHIILASAGEVSGDMLSHETLITEADSVPDAERGKDDVAGIFYTGGTTGLPKGVMLTHTNLVSNAMVSLLNMYEGKPWRYLHSAPMFHIADFQWVIGVTLHAGTHVFMPKFGPEDMLKMIQKYHVTNCALVPTMLSMVLNLPNLNQYDVTSLRGMNYGGSPLPAELIVKARPAFPNCRFFQGYGQTETSPNISMLTDEYHDLGEDKIDSAGQPVFTVEVRIVDFNDDEVPPGTIGEITARGPTIMTGYWNKPQETSNALRGGWMHTGDAGYMDEDGFLYIVDRVKDMVISGGENIYSAEVETAIYRHDSVAMCAVIGIPDEKWGEAVHAIVVLKDGKTLTEAELIQHCREYIAGYKCPRSVEIRREPMPMTGAGKILKRELRKPYWEGKKRDIN